MNSADIINRLRRLGMEVNMLYPVYVHMGDEDHAHGITIPDFPGCFLCRRRLGHDPGHGPGSG